MSLCPSCDADRHHTLNGRDGVSPAPGVGFQHLQRHVTAREVPSRRMICSTGKRKRGFDRMVVHESVRVRLVDQGWLCGRGVGGDGDNAAANNDHDCPAVGSPACSRVAAGSSCAAAWRSAAESQRRGDRRRSPEHDGAARDHRPAAGAERQRVGAQPRQLRRGARQSVPEAAGRADARRTAARSRARPRGGSSGGREIVEEFDREVLGRVPKNVPKVTWVVNRTEDVHGGRTAGRRQGARRQSRQRVLSGRSPSTFR